MSKHKKRTIVTSKELSAIHRVFMMDGYQYNVSPATTDLSFDRSGHQCLRLLLSLCALRCGPCFLFILALKNVLPEFEESVASGLSLAPAALLE